MLAGPSRLDSTLTTPGSPLRTR